MNRSFVVDASVAIAWVHPGQASAETNAMLDGVAAGDSLVIPALWPLEVANALIVLERRRKLRADETRSALEILRKIPATVDHEAASIALTSLADLASEHDVTVYDAVYLELARRRQLSLATNDARMKRAAIRAGISLWE